MTADAEDSTVSSSTSTRPTSPDKIEEKVTDAAEQLSKDASLLEKVMGRSSHWKTQDTTRIVKQVIAVPNLTRQDLSDFGLQEKVKKVSHLPVIAQCQRLLLNNNIIIDKTIFIKSAKSCP